jgi:hypothetical protein
MHEKRLADLTKDIERFRKDDEGVRLEIERMKAEHDQIHGKVLYLAYRDRVSWRVRPLT